MVWGGSDPKESAEVPPQRLVTNEVVTLGLRVSLCRNVPIYAPRARAIRWRGEEPVIWLWIWLCNRYPMVKLVSGRAAVPQEHQGVSMRPLRWLELPAPVCKSALSGRDLGLYGGLAAVRVVESLCPTHSIKIKICRGKHKTVAISPLNTR